MIDLAGSDATQEFEDVDHSEDARARLEELLIGKLEDPISTGAAPRSWQERLGISTVGSQTVGSALVIMGALVAAMAALVTWRR